MSDGLRRAMTEFLDAYLESEGAPSTGDREKFSHGLKESLLQAAKPFIRRKVMDSEPDDYKRSELIRAVVPELDGVFDLMVKDEIRNLEERFEAIYQQRKGGTSTKSRKDSKVNATNGTNTGSWRRRARRWPGGTTRNSET